MDEQTPRAGPLITCYPYRYCLNNADAYLIWYEDDSENFDKVMFDDADCLLTFQSLAEVEDYSVSNRGLRAGLIGTPQQVIDQVAAFEAAGVNLLLLQCSPQLEEMERFADQVIHPVRR